MKKLRLRSKMIATYLVACMIPLLASSLILYWTSAETLETSTRELTRIFSSQIVTEIDGLINDYDQLTKVVLVDSDTLKELKRDSKSVIDEVNRKLLMRKIQNIYALHLMYINLHLGMKCTKNTRVQESQCFLN